MVQFLRGFVIGAAASAAVVIIVTPRSGAETRQIIINRVNGSIEVGRKAAVEHEQKMWEEFRQKREAGHANTNGRTNAQPPW
jgi:gas vesicle protein